jgi:hypothetical protein
MSLIIIVSQDSSGGLINADLALYLGARSEKDKQRSDRSLPSPIFSIFW